MSSLDQTSSKTQQNIDRNSAQDAAESLGAMADHIVQDEEISVAQDGGVVHEEVEEYEGNGDLRLSEVAAHMVAAAKSSEEAGEDYEMVGHHQEAEVGNGEEVLDQEAYGAEHEYAEYDMAEVDMTQGVEGDQGAQAAEYADNVAGTDAGSILATQDNGEEDQLLDDGQQNAEYSYDQEMIDEGEKAQGMGIDENGEEIVDDHGHHQHHAQTGQQLEHQDQQVSHESEHQQGMYDEQDDQSGQMYESAPVDAAPMDYTIISTAAANSSLAALSQAITSSVSRLTGDLSTEDQELHEHHEHQLLQQPDDGQDGHLQGQDQEQASQEQQQEQQEQEQGQQDQEPKDHHDAGGYALSSDLGSHGSVQQGLPHSEPHSHSHTHSPSPLAGNSGGAVSTPIGYKTSGRLMESQNVTPAKRPHSSHGAASSNSRLKSKVWNWYDILPDSYRQCRFCPQKYGPLTATTILARHYHNRHDLNPPVGGTPSHRGSASHVHAGSQGTHTPTHQHLALSQAGQAVYNQAAAAAAAAAAAVTANGGATPAESQTGHIFHAQSNGGSAYGQSTLAVANGTATDEILRSVVSEAVQNGPYEENQIIMQDGFSTMMTSPLSRINLTPARKAIAAVAQFCAQGDIQKNLQTCVQLISSAARRGAKMVFLPEASDFIAETRVQPSQQAQSLDGPFMKEIQQAAKDNGIWISIGVHEQPPVNGMPYNTNAVISDEGTLVSVYRKLHLFDVNLKDGPRLIESSVTSRGEQIADPIDTPVGKLGLSICYDLRFPELAQRLRHRGAQLLCYPSAFTEATGAPHWEVLLRSRAIETQTYVFAAAQIGKHNPKRSSYGDAMIVDPWGAVVARCSRNSSEPTLATAEVNLDFLDKVRRESPVFSHKRTDIFPEYAS